MVLLHDRPVLITIQQIVDCNVIPAYQAYLKFQTNLTLLDHILFVLSKP